MKYLKNSGWFLLAFIAWCWESCVFLVKKSMKWINRFFSRENLRKNKIKFIAGSVLILVVIFPAWYVFRKYQIVFISKDEQKQSAPEKNYLNAMKRAAVKELNEKSGKKSAPSAPSKAVYFRGDVIRIGENDLIIKTEKGEEQAVMLNEKTKAYPANKKLLAGQAITVSAHLENDKAVADRISIRTSPTVGSDMGD